jgi:hypothetical protein
MVSLKLFCSGSVLEAFWNVLEASEHVPGVRCGLCPDRVQLNGRK